MEQEKFQEFDEDFALLIEAGFIAIKQLDEMSAKKIFQAAQIIRPDSQIPKMGIASIALNKLELKEAIRLYGEVLEKEPQNHTAQVFLGLSYLFSKNNPGYQKKGEKLIRETLEKTDEPIVKQLGISGLEWLEKEKGKTKPPFFNP